jgi:hypothetical protein
MSDEGLSLGTEGRKFLRYVMPGLVFGVETLLLFYIAMPVEALGFLDKVGGKEASFGTIAGIFLASGGLGYIFASIHHWILWNLERRTLNHVKVIRKLTQSGKIALDMEEQDKFGNIKEPKNTVEIREIAQSNSLALWHFHVKLKLPEKDHLDYLGNQAHGLGAARVASFFALLATIWLCNRYGDLKYLWQTPDFVIMIVLGGFIFCVFLTGYWRVSRIAQRIYDRTLVDFIK